MLAHVQYTNCLWHWTGIGHELDFELMLDIQTALITQKWALNHKCKGFSIDWRCGASIPVPLAC